MAIQVADDRGVVSTQRTFPAFAVRSDASDSPIVSLGPFEDGFFEVQLLAVARSSDDTGSAVDRVYVKASREGLTLLTPDEYYSESDANLAVEVKP